MSPPNSENDPVQKGLHQLGRQIERKAGARRSRTVEPVEDPAENPVEKGLHELGRQIDEANRAGRAAEGQGAADPDARRHGPAHAAPKGRSRKRTAAWVGGTRHAGPRAGGRRGGRLRLVPQS